MPPLAAASIGDLLVGACKQFAGRPAFTCMGKSISFGELERQSAAFGAWLQATGLAKGARVAIMMPNVLQYPVAMMGVLRAGYTVVNVNPLYTPRELEHQLKDSGAEAIVVLENFAKTLQTVDRQDRRSSMSWSPPWATCWASRGSLVNFVVRRVKKLVPAWSLPGHVSFNAALSEGAERAVQAGQGRARRRRLPAIYRRDDRRGQGRHAARTATCWPMSAQLAMWVEEAYRVKPKPADLVYICALPLYHIFALTVNALMGMQQGAQNVLIPNPRDIPGFVKELQKYKFHIFPGLNTLFNALLNNEQFRAARLQAADPDAGRRHGGAEGRGRALEGADRQQHHRRLRPVGNVAGCDRELRHGAPTSAARSACRCRRRNCRSATTTARKCRSARSARSASRVRR